MSPLRIPAFRLLVTGQFASTIGDYCYAVALPWLVFSNHGNAALLGVVLACYGVPRTVLIPAGGILADKIGPRTLMMLADLGRCVLVAVLAVLAARHTASLVALGPTAALIGAGEGLFLPASYSILPAILDGERLGAGNALSSAAVQAGSLLGPALGGAVVAITGASTAAFTIDAVSFAISALTLAFIRLRPAPASELADAALSGLRSDSDEGRQHLEAPASEEAHKHVRDLLLRWKPMRVILLTTIAANLASGGMGEVALPALAHEHWGAAGYGAILACFAGGALVGTLAATRTTSVSRPAMFITVLFMINALADALIPFAGGQTGAAIAFFVAGVTNGMGNVVAITMIQRAIPPALTGRIMSAVILCSFGSFPLSVAAGGLLVRHFGPVPFFPIGSGILVAALLYGLSQREFRVFGSAEAVPLDEVDIAEPRRDAPADPSRPQAADGSRR
jgi:predicted MFS family arabinose efflux permease